MAAAIAICLPMVVSVGGGELAFAMYSSSTWFRIELTGLDATNQSSPIAPTLLADRVVPSASPFLAGSDHFRRTNDASALRAHLADVARVGCVEAPRAVVVTISLVERAGSVDGPERTTAARVVCAR